MPGCLDGCLPVLAALPFSLSLYLALLPLPWLFFFFHFSCLPSPLLLDLPPFSLAGTQASSLDFLASNKFDFNKFVYDGESAVQHPHTDGPSACAVARSFRHSNRHGVTAPQQTVNLWVDAHCGMMAKLL